MKGFVFITGASSGIGLELAKAYAERGRDLILIARRESVLQKLRSDLMSCFDIEVIVYHADISSMQSVSSIVDDIVRKGIVIETLINNAGAGGHGLFHETDFQMNAAMIDLNCKALVQLTHRVIPLMIEQKTGHILNIASTAAMLPGPLQSVYYASKAFVLSFSQALSEELQSFGISITAFSPGSTKTEFHVRGNLERTKLFQGRLASASSVAKQAIRALKKKRISATSNRPQMFLLRFMLPFIPKRTMLRISRSYLEQTG